MKGQGEAGGRGYNQEPGRGGGGPCWVDDSKAVHVAWAGRGSRAEWASMGRVAREREAGQGGNGAKPFDGTRPGTSQAPVPWGC